MQETSHCIKGLQAIMHGIQVPKTVPKAAPKAELKSQTALSVEVEKRYTGDLCTYLHLQVLEVLHESIKNNHRKS